MLILYSAIRRNIKQNCSYKKGPLIENQTLGIFIFEHLIKVNIVSEWLQNNNRYFTLKEKENVPNQVPA